MTIEYFFAYLNYFSS